MILASATAILAACLVRLAAGQVVSYEAAVKSEAHDTRGSSESRELQVDPQLRLLVESGSYALSAAYAPQLAVRDAPADFRALHRAAVVGALFGAGSWRLDGVATGAYGHNDLSQPSLQLTPQPAGPVQPVQPVQPLPRSTVVPYVSGAISLTLSRRLDDASGVAATVAGSIDGSPGSGAQLPLQRSANLDLRYGWVGQLNAATTTFTMTATRFSTDSSEVIAVLAEEWRHTFRQDLQAWIGAGPAFTWTRFDGGLSTAPILPASSPRPGTSHWVSVAGEVGVRERFEPGLDGTLAVHASPISDRVTGLVYDRADARTTIDWRISPDWTMTATLSHGVVLTGTQSGEQITSGELRFLWAERGPWEFLGGLRALRQINDPRHDGAVTLWTTFVGVTGRDRDRLY